MHNDPPPSRSAENRFDADHVVVIGRNPAESSVRPRRYVSVGVDGSAQSDVAARFAADEARMRGLPLLLVHAYEDRGRSRDDVQHIMGDASEAEGVLNSSWAQLAPPDSLRVESRLYQGQPVDLLRDIQDESALLVLGHRPPLAGTVSGPARGLTTKVLAHAAAPWL